MNRLTAYAAAVRTVAWDEKVAFIDRLTLMPQWAREGLIRPEDLTGPDGVHMTDRGYQLLAQATYEAILATAPQLRGSTRADARQSTAPADRF